MPKLSGDFKCANDNAPAVRAGVRDSWEGLWSAATSRRFECNTRCDPSACPVAWLMMVAQRKGESKIPCPEV